ncbi:hypothetical protein MSG28_010962 [Choristoneura fumiferana]|uniref:Uncharacterized protein n=1 Tax=Choristoneura fumiferana TaxID=7141 RepID=A0ACC0KQL4_CHOFU|nr:hypothetical protein MSG28_010962 [Choristoneura fumiferana]
MWSCSSVRSTISTGTDSFTDLGLHDKKMCTRNDSFTDHGFHDMHIKVEVMAEQYRVEHYWSPNKVVSDIQACFVFVSDIGAGGKIVVI